MAKVNKLIFWTPRILAILFILFLAMFSLDIFEGNYGFWRTILGLFMHNIPALILSILLIISWKHEIVGAITFFLAGILYLFILLMSDFQFYMLLWILQIAGPAFLVGVLFFIGWRQKRKRIHYKISNFKFKNHFFLNLS